MNIYIIDFIGKHCGMHYYINSFIKEINRCTDANVEILSNFNTDDRIPFLVDHYEGNKFAKIFKFACNYIKLIKFLLTHRHSIVIYMNYGDLLDIVILPFVCKTKHVIDIHEAIAQSKDQSTIHQYCFRKLYSNYIKTLMFHSDRAKNMLCQLGFKGKKMYVPHFRYEISRTYDESKISDDVFASIKQDMVNVLFFGNLTKEKGVDLLLAAANKLTSDTKRKINIIIAGKNIDDSVFLVATEEDVSLSKFVRHISDDELNYFYSKCQAIAMPYRKTSQSGVLEMAFFHKLPVLATRIPYFEKTLGLFPSFGELADCNPNGYAKALDSFVEKYGNGECYYKESDYKKYIHREEVDIFFEEFNEFIKNR